MCTLSFWSATGIQKNQVSLSGKKALGLLQLWQVKLKVNTEGYLRCHAEPMSQQPVRGTCWCSRLKLGFNPPTFNSHAGNLNWKHSHEKGHERLHAKPIWHLFFATTPYLFNNACKQSWQWLLVRNTGNVCGGSGTRTTAKLQAWKNGAYLRNPEWRTQNRIQLFYEYIYIYIFDLRLK